MGVAIRGCVDDDLDALAATLSNGACPALVASPEVQAELEAEFRRRGSRRNQDKQPTCQLDAQEP